MTAAAAWDWDAGIPDSTAETTALLRGLRKGRARKRAAGLVYQVYLGVFLLVTYGGTLVAGTVRALRHAPPAGAYTADVLRAEPAGLTALGLLLVLAVTRDALWRGPVLLPQPTADWLLGTLVRRARLLRPRFAVAAALAVAGGAVAGLVPAAALVTVGLAADPGPGTGRVLRLAGTGALGAALLAACATGAAALVERYPAGRRWLRAATPAMAAAVAACCAIAAWTVAGAAASAATPVTSLIGKAPGATGAPGVLSRVAEWSGPWGWACQGLIAAAGGPAPLWPLATGLLAAAAVAAVGFGYAASASVPASALRSRARTIGAMSGALLSADPRGATLARGAALRTPGRARFRLAPPRRRWLAVPWRDLLALVRAPARLVTGVVLALAAVGLLALAGRGGQVSLVPVAGALSGGYLAAAMLCEGARLDADDPRRTAGLPLRFGSLAAWHAVVPCAILLLTAGLPAVALTVAGGDPRPAVLVVVTTPVLVAGALVNAYRGPMPADALSGFETGLGNTAVVNLVIWYALGAVLAITPMTLLLPGALQGGAAPGARAAAVAATTRAVVLGTALAAALGLLAFRRARRLGASLSRSPALKDLPACGPRIPAGTPGMSDPPRNVAGMKMKLRKRRHECPDCAREAAGPAGDLDAPMSWIVAQVGAIGWAVPGVAIDGVAPPWAYSVGLWASYGMPDLAAFGRPLRQLGVIVNSLAVRVADGSPVGVGDEFDDVCPRMLAIRDIHESWRITPMFGASDQFHGYVRPPMLQVVWADRGGAFPWDPRFEPEFAGAQPMLWLPVDDHPPGPWTRLNQPG